MKAFGGNNTRGPIDVATAVNAKGGAGRMDFESETFVTHSLRAEGFDAGEDGTGRGVPLVPVAQPIPILESGSRPGTSTDDPRAGIGIGQPGDPMYTLQGGKQHAVAFNLRGREGGAQPEVSDVASLRSASGGSSRSYAATEYAVRRLTVRECEVLQGLPPGYCAITGRPRKITADEAAYLSHHGLHVWQNGEQWMTDVVADGPQYKAIGNGWAIPCVAWIAERIDAADKEFRGKND